MAARCQWVKPSTDDVTTMMSSLVQGAVQKDPGGTTKNRVASALTLAVEKVRSAVAQGKRVPLSLTAGVVPPSGHIHTIILAIDISVSSTPNMDLVNKAGFGDLKKEAKEWLKDVASGKQPVDYPIDPDQTTLPYGTDPGYGGETQVDLSTDGSEASYYVPPSPAQAVAPTNVQAIAGLGRIDLEWDVPMNPANSPITYTVYRGTASMTYGTPLATGLIQSSFSDNSVTSGTTYFYAVTATNSAGVSGYSTEQSVKAL